MTSLKITKSASWRARADMCSLLLNTFEVWTRTGMGKESREGTERGSGPAHFAPCLEILPVLRDEKYLHCTAEISYNILAR